MLMLAEPVRADEAHRLGLLNRLVDDDAAVLAVAGLWVSFIEGFPPGESWNAWFGAVVNRGDPR